MREGRSFAVLGFLLGAAAAPAGADLAVSRSGVSLVPGEDSPVIQLTVTNAAPSTAPASLAVSGLPPGAGTRPFSYPGQERAADRFG